MIRAAIVVTVLLLGLSPAHAIPWMVKQAVAQYGAAAVEAWARAHGISDKEIQIEKRCVK
jgi:hypothetical protein